MENELILGKQNEIALLLDNPLGDLLKPLSNEVFLLASYIAGTSHLRDDFVLEELEKGDKLLLLREPENHFDPDAIQVLDSKKRKLGYIPEKDNIVFARLMDAGKYLSAKVSWVNLRDSFQQIGIKIYLVDF